MRVLYREQAGVRLRRVAWSPEGTRIASASSSGTTSAAGLVQVWDAESGTTLLSYQGHTSGAIDVAWSPDGERLASAGGPDGTAQVWEASSGRLLVTYQDSKRVAAAAAAAAAATQQHPKVQQMQARLRQEAIQAGMFPAWAWEQIQWVNALAWSPDGARIASTCASDAHVWEAATGRHLLTYGSHRMQIEALAWSPAGPQVATLTGWLVQVWDGVEKGRGLLIYRGHAGEGSSVSSLAWSPDGTLMASGTSNGTVNVWNAGSGETLLTYRGHAPEGELVTNPANTPPDPAASLRMLHLHLSQRLGDPRFVTATPLESSKMLNEHLENSMRTNQARREQGLPAIRSHRPPPNTWNVAALAWSPNGTRLASGSWDKTVQVWDARTGERLALYQEHTAPVTTVAWSPDGTRLVSADTAGLAHVWAAE
jgi:WD40 repeat protein